MCATKAATVRPGNVLVFKEASRAAVHPDRRMFPNVIVAILSGHSEYNNCAILEHDYLFSDKQTELIGPAISVLALMD